MDRLPDWLYYLVVAEAAYISLVALLVLASLVALTAISLWNLLHR